MRYAGEGKPRAKDAQGSGLTGSVAGATWRDEWVL